MAGWTEDELALLKKLTAEGLSASMISARIPGRSRNAIVGCWHREGLKVNAQPRQRKKRVSSLPIKPSTDYRYRNTPAATSAHVRALRSLEAKMRYAETSKAMKQPDDGIEPLMVPLLELEPHHCRFPIGDVHDDDFAFCGHMKLEGSSYCPVHHARSRVSVPAQRRVQPTPTRKAA